MKKFLLIIPALVGASMLTGCVEEEVYVARPVGVAYAGGGYVGDPYYSYGGLDYYYVDGRYFYYRNHHPIYVTVLPHGGRYYGGYHGNNHNNYNNNYHGNSHHTDSRYVNRSENTRVVNSQTNVRNVTNNNTTVVNGQQPRTTHGHAVTPQGTQVKGQQPTGKKKPVKKGDEHDHDSH